MDATSVSATSRRSTRAPPIARSCRPWMRSPRSRSMPLRRSGVINSQQSAGRRKTKGGATRRLSILSPANRELRTAALLRRLVFEQLRRLGFEPREQMAGLPEAAVVGTGAEDDDGDRVALGHFE